MKRSAVRSSKVTELPVAWLKAEYAARWANIADTFDDRVSEDIFDVEDEHAEVEIISRRMMHGPN